MNLSTAMDAIAAAFTAAGVRAYAWPKDGVAAPCVVVGYPDEINLNLAFGRSGNEAKFPIYLVVGKVNEESSRDSLTSLLTAAKTALDGVGGDLTARVESVSIGGVEYLAAVLMIDWLA
ncbi:MAG: hypothetical protein WB239_11145 [Acidimicrobiia bacterium]